VVASKRINLGLKEGRLLGYFTALGLGYLFIEIALIQKFILFVGHPVYAVSLVLSSILFFSGVGSLISRRYSFQSLGRILGVLCFAALGYLLLLPYVLELLIGASFTLRLVSSIMLLAPLALLMGMPFPLGIKIVDSLDKRLVPWVWCVNACASVFGSVLAALIALSFGFSSVVFLAAFVYFAGLLAVYRFTGLPEPSLSWERT
jgi:hypothetical protein